MFLYYMDFGFLLHKGEQQCPPCGIAAWLLEIREECLAWHLTDTQYAVTERDCHHSHPFCGPVLFDCSFLFGKLFLRLLDAHTINYITTQDSFPQLSCSLSLYSLSQSFHHHNFCPDFLTLSNLKGSNPGIKPRTSCMLSMCPTTELHPKSPEPTLCQCSILECPLGTSNSVCPHRNSSSCPSPDSS